MLLKPQSGRTVKKNTKIAQRSNRSFLNVYMYNVGCTKERLRCGGHTLNLPLFRNRKKNYICPFHLFSADKVYIVCEICMWLLWRRQNNQRRTGVNLCRVLVFFFSSSSSLSDSAENPLCVCANRTHTMHM